MSDFLEVKVVDCTLKDKELLTWNDSYVCVEYGGSTFRTHTCNHGGRDPKNPTFNETLRIRLIEGLKKLKITVWNQHKSQDTHIGSGIVELYKVLSEGDDDTSWPIQTTHDKYSGVVHLIMHFSGAPENPSASAPPRPATPLPAYAPPPVAYIPVNYPCPAQPYAGYPPAPINQYSPVVYPVPCPPPGAQPPSYYQPPPQGAQPPNYHQPPPPGAQPPNYYRPPPQGVQPPNYYQPAQPGTQRPNYYQPPPPGAEPPNYYQPPPQGAQPPNYYQPPGPYPGYPPPC